MSKKVKNYLNVTKQLTWLAASCLFLIFTLYTATQALVKKNETNYLKNSLLKVLPEGTTLNEFDNNVLEDKQTIEKRTIYPACKKGQLQYILMEIETDKGYSGTIRLLVNIDIKNKHLLASRPLFHQETPGLGDQIDPDKSDWLKQFSLPLATNKNLSVDKDGGDIDAIAGATITSRAVSNLFQEEIFSKKREQLQIRCNTIPHINKIDINNNKQAHKPNT